MTLKDFGWGIYAIVMALIVGTLGIFIVFEVMYLGASFALQRFIGGDWWVATQFLYRAAAAVAATLIVIRIAIEIADDAGWL